MRLGVNPWQRLPSIRLDHCGPDGSSTRSVSSVSTLAFGHDDLLANIDHQHDAGLDRLCGWGWIRTSAPFGTGLQPVGFNHSHHPSTKSIRANSFSFRFLASPPMNTNLSLSFPFVNRKNHELCNFFNCLLRIPKTHFSRFFTQESEYFTKLYAARKRGH